MGRGTWATCRPATGSRGSDGLVLPPPGFRAGIPARRAWRPERSRARAPVHGLRPPARCRHRGHRRRAAVPRDLPRLLPARNPVTRTARESLDVERFGYAGRVGPTPGTSRGVGLLRVLGGGRLPTPAEGTACLTSRSLCTSS